MLPDDVWYHYYDRPCEFCEEQVHHREEDTWAYCAMCSKLMCEDCRDAIECHVCQDKLAEDEDASVDGSYLCQECIQSCGTCNVNHHPNCRDRHAATCNELGRAKREADKAQEEVDDKESAIAHRKRQLRELERELASAKKAKTKAEKKLGDVQKKANVKPSK
mmetsp:Transcript_6580/g.13748  ORF Transcript_6580/g.13748 Transcript_6580/m.13748 type:complete len:163 (-) Transcript_6580:107-595(-)